MDFFIIIIVVFLAILIMVIWRNTRTAIRAEFIRNYAFPPGLFNKLRTKQPHLSLKDCQLVSHALRHFFIAYLKSKCKFISMPSQVADDLWHEFILYTRDYEDFCEKAFGQFLHHTPAVVLGSNKQSNQGLRRVWWYTCREEHINPKKPTRLPLLFALDEKLGIKNGFHYSPDCKALQKNNGTEGNSSVVHCGGDFASSGFDGSTDGFGDSSSHDGGGSDGGDGGSGCGGGCGGGGGD